MMDQRMLNFIAAALFAIAAALTINEVGFSLGAFVQLLGVVVFLGLGLTNRQLGTP